MTYQWNVRDHDRGYNPEILTEWISFYKTG
jgi:hypothetical protein